MSTKHTQNSLVIMMYDFNIEEFYWRLSRCMFLQNFVKLRILDAHFTTVWLNWL